MVTGSVRPRPDLRVWLALGFAVCRAMAPRVAEEAAPVYLAKGAKLRAEADSGGRPIGPVLVATPVTVTARPGDRITVSISGWGRAMSRGSIRAADPASHRNIAAVQQRPPDLLG